MASLQSIAQSEALATKRIFASGDDEDVGVGLILQYIGSEASGTVTVTVTTGDITFKHGDVGSEAVDATIDSGGDDPGVIDMSDSNANTVIEVEGLINGSKNWRARMTGSLPDDATAGYFITMSATQAKVAAGIPLYIDGSVLDVLTFGITGTQFNNLSVQDGWRSHDGLVTDEACVNVLDYYAITNTFASGSSLVAVYEVEHGDATGTKLHSVPLTTATKLEKGENSPATQFIRSSINKRLVVRIENTSIDLTVNDMLVQGRVVDYAQQPRVV